MYPQFFGLEKLPFRLRLDADFLYAGREYLGARTDMLAALRSGARVVLLSGYPGAGKTLLLDDVLREVGGQFALCRINQPHISSAELLQALKLQLGIDSLESNDLRGALHAPPLLVIDDAHLLTGATLVTVADIASRVARLKVILIEGKDARGTLGHAAPGVVLRIPVAQKPIQVFMSPLDEAASKAYIEHRLAVAGGGGKVMFTPEAHAMIFQHTAGAARLINVLCDAALHAACTRAAGQVGVAEVLVATQDSRWPEALARNRVQSDAEPAGGLAQREELAAASNENLEHRETVVYGISDPVHAPAPEAASAGLAASAGSAENAVPAASVRPAKSARPATSEAGVATTRAQLLVSHRKIHIAAVHLETGRFSVGRATDNELCLEAPFISRHHCRIVTVGEVSTIEDLGSVNGIAVNGRMVKRHVLQHADQIAVGEHLLTYVLA